MESPFGGNRLIRSLYGLAFWITLTSSQFLQTDLTNATALPTQLSFNSDLFATQKPAPVLTPVLTETCGDSFTKNAFVPFLAKENHEIGRLVDFDGGPGWSPFVIVSGNEKALFRIDSEGTIRVAFPFFDTDSDEYHLRLASVNGNLICTVQLNIKVAPNATTANTQTQPAVSENNVPIRSENVAAPFVFPTTAPSTTVPSTTATTKTITFVLPSTIATTTAAPNQPANIVSSNRELALAADSDSSGEPDQITKKQGFLPGATTGQVGTYPFGPRCTDPLITVAVPSDAAPNTPIAKVTATHQVGMPITYSIPDVVFDRFWVDPLSGQVFTGPEPLSRTRPFGDGRVYPQTRSALEFRVRAAIPGGTHCETVLRINVVPSVSQSNPPPALPPARAPPVFVSPLNDITVNNCQPGFVFAQVKAVDPENVGRIQYLLDNPSNEMSVNLNTGELRTENVNPTFHQRRVTVRAINVDSGLSSTSNINVIFRCEFNPNPFPGMPLSGMRFTRPNYRYLITNCNSGTQINPNDRIQVVGNQNVPTLSLSNPNEFFIDPSGLLVLRVMFNPGSALQRDLLVFATTPDGQRAQTSVTLDIRCMPGPGFPGRGEIEPPFPAFTPNGGPLGPPRSVNNPQAIDQPFGPGQFPFASPGNPNIPGPPFPPGGVPFGPGVNPNFPFGRPGNPAGNPFGPNPQPGSPFTPFPGAPNPDGSGNPQPPFPMFDPLRGPLSEPRNINQPPPPITAISGPNINPNLNPNMLNPNFNAFAAAMGGALFGPQFPSRQLRPLNQLLEESPISRLGMLFGDIPVNMEFMGRPAENQNQNQNRDSVGESGSQEASAAGGNEQGDDPSAAKSAEDPNQLNGRITSNRQLTSSFGSSSFGPFLSKPSSGNSNAQKNPSKDLSDPFPVVTSDNPFPVSAPKQLPSISAALGSPLAQPHQNPQFQDFQPSMFGAQSPFPMPILPPGFMPPNRPMGPLPQLPNFPQFPIGLQPQPFPMNMPPNLLPMPQPVPRFPGQLPFPLNDRPNPSEVSARLGPVDTKAPPVFVTPFCAPPGTTFIGRIKALIPDPADRVQYFIWSTGGSDVFDLNSATGELRSRVSLSPGTYNVDVAAKDSTGRMTVMRLEIKITPSCSQPTLGSSANPFFSLDIVTHGAAFSPPTGSGPKFLQPVFTFTIPAAAPPRTLIGQVQALSGSGEPLQYFLSPSGEFEIDNQGRIFNRGFVQVPRTLTVTAVDSLQRSATASVNIVGPGGLRGVPGGIPCADDLPESAARTTGNGGLPNINHFGSVRQRTKSLLSITGPTLVAVDAPYIGVLPVTLAKSTNLAEYNVTGGSGTYRWMDKEGSLFEMSGDSTATLRNRGAMQPGIYQHTSTVKDNAGNVADLTVKVIVRQPDLSDNQSTPFETGPARNSLDQLF